MTDEDSDTDSRTFVSDIRSRVQEQNPPEPGESCSNCAEGVLEKDTIVQTPFGDLWKYTCTECELETAGPVR